MPGAIDLPLHGGHAPCWLFQRMRRLSRAIGNVIVEEFGTGELLERLANPLWFQALGCVTGFDWHSSGLTTVTVGALREAGVEGLGVAGGKGHFRRIPGQLEGWGDQLGLPPRRVEELKRSSKMSAKADTVGLVDGFGLYHHAIAFDAKGNWTVIQQGMNDSWARRYHLSNTQNFTEEPNTGVACDTTGQPVNMVAAESGEARELVVELLEDFPCYTQAFNGQATLSGNYVRMPRSHDFNKWAYRNLLKAYEANPADFRELMLSGVNPKGMRALAMLAEVIYGKGASRKDPVRYSFAHGGKDGVPYPVDRERYDRSIGVLEGALEGADVEKREKLGALRRLSEFTGRQV